MPEMAPFINYWYVWSIYRLYNICRPLHRRTIPPLFSERTLVSLSPQPLHIGILLIGVFVFMLTYLQWHV
ncbi:hypothetical protein BDW74DRAFT_159194 [Aspergillus multicolor]|uniref:uncharacterized protein n=1 Tax=Aspergillus multicolor TaxID=41759 RepID=UPI003CCD63CC